MSDSDDDECCPELVEEDLSKVGNKNLIIIIIIRRWGIRIFLEEFVVVMFYPKAEDLALILKYVSLITF